jgi:endonuclease-3
MTKKNIKEVIERLEALYPDAKAELDFKNPLQLLIAVILSAQCTDVRVNQVTKVLFEVAGDALSLSELPIEQIEEIIKPCGLYKTKSKNIQETARRLVAFYGGEVPSSHEALTELPGVGRKTANVVVSNAFGIPAIAVDTHVFRVSNRIGLAKASTVEATESQLMKAIDKEKWTLAHHMIIFHGRRVCKARQPQCEVCTLSDLCEFYKKNQRRKV